MSLKTWRAEFYPETAKAAAKRGDIAATEHSLRKWLGLRAGALKRHEVSVNTIGDLWDEEEGFSINDETCALCVRHIRNGCVDCPLFESLGARCDGIGAPFGVWMNEKNPNPMIAALRKTLRWLKAQARRKA